MKKITRKVHFLYFFIMALLLIFAIPVKTHAMALAPSWFPTECCSNVIFIPGLEASHLYADTSGILGTSTSKLWEPHRNDNVRSLFLDADGKSINPAVYTNDIINKANVLGVSGGDIYDDFSKTMDALVANKSINAWESLPYDWRVNVNDIINKPLQYATTTKLIVSDIISMASTSQTRKVTLIAHSNGGLVAKMLMNVLEQQGRADLVDKLLFIAVPELGTPSAIGALLHGYDQSLGAGLLLSTSVARQFAENMSSAYGLIPSLSYFNKVNAAITLPSSYTSSSLYDTFTHFLLGKDGREKPTIADTLSPNILNSKLLSAAETIHSVIDNWLPPAGVKLIQIAGWGVHTLKGISYKEEDKQVCNADGSLCHSRPNFIPTPLYSIEGDKTVVYPSAHGTDGVTDNYFLNLEAYNKANNKSREHKDIMEVPPLLDEIKHVVTSTSESIEPSIYITKEKPDPKSAGEILQLAMHSPANINLYDNKGNHTGPIANPDPDSDLELYENKIPNSYYEHFGEAVYAGMPNEEGGKVELQGTGFGTFTFDVARVFGDETIASTTFKDVPVTPELKAYLDFTSASSSENSAAQMPLLILDINGDGVNDIVASSSPAEDPALFISILRKTIALFGLPNERLLILNKKIDTIEKLLLKGKKEKAIAKIDHFAAVFKDKKWSVKYLSPNEENELSSILEEFVNAIN